MDNEPKVTTGNEASLIENMRRNRSVRKMKKFVVKKLLKGDEIIPAQPGRFRTPLQSTLSPRSERNAAVITRVQTELANAGVHVETIEQMDPDSSDAYTYAFAPKPAQNHK